MPAPVSLPTICWGPRAASRRALLVHGLGSNSALMWRFGTALAEAGWHACAVDLRGHGVAPRTLDYTIDAYAADLADTRPAGGGAWDLVVGHSLGGAAAVTASAEHPQWARRLVLVDPAIVLAGRDHDGIRNSQLASFEEPSAAEVLADNPRWHPQDAELKVSSVAQSSHWAVIATMDQNTPWDVREAAAKLSVPTHVLAGDPQVYSLFREELAEQVLRNPAITMSRIPGAGHSPHRDSAEAAMAAFGALL